VAHLVCYSIEAFDHTMTEHGSQSISHWPLLSSPQNERIKGVVALRDRRDRRDHDQAFLVEGVRELTQALRMEGLKLLQLFVCPEIAEFSSANSDFIGKLASCQHGFRVTRAVFNKIAMRENHGGLVAVFSQPDMRLSRLRLPPNPLLLIVEGVEKPGNLGALLRSADAAGIDGVIVTDAHLDVFNPNAVRASLGAIFTVPLAVASKEEVRSYCRSNSLKVFAATPLSPAVDYWKADFVGGSAIILGSEAFGLSEYWLEHADVRLQIPMAGDIDSLNLSVAGALLLFEARRQRR
jgi:RNA methyltransferase, TrmH family